MTDKRLDTEAIKAEINKEEPDYGRPKLLLAMDIVRAIAEAPEPDYDKCDADYCGNPVPRAYEFWTWWKAARALVGGDE